MIENEQLVLNQKFIDLYYEYEDSGLTYGEFDPEGFMKFLWNRGYKISPRYS